MSSTPAQNQAPASGLENIKALNATIPKTSNVAIMLDSVIQSKKRLDALIKKEGERFKLLELARRDEKKRLAAIEKEKVKDIAANQEVVATPIAQVPKVVASQPAKPVVKDTGLKGVKIEAPKQAKEGLPSYIKKPAPVKEMVVAPVPLQATTVAAKPVDKKAVTPSAPQAKVIIPGAKAGATTAKIGGMMVTVTAKSAADANRTFTPSYIKGRIAPSAKTQETVRPNPKDRHKGVIEAARASKAAAAGGAPRPLGVGRPGSVAPPPASATGARVKTFTNDATKRKEYRPDDRGRGMSKRTLIRKGFIDQGGGFDEDRTGVRKLKNKRKLETIAPSAIVIEKAVITTENLTVKILSEKIGKTSQAIIKKLMLLGIMTSINSVVDFATMELVASELGVELELKLDKTKETLLEEGHDEADDDKDLVKRPPIITVMGHVDHGKTSLLDAIRKTNVASGEAGGITQGIGAYSVPVKGERITFLDTPGHEAFTLMRARGAQVTDIAVLVVAADDGIMPQTIEAISHAKSANVPILVAVNKIDKPGANVQKVREMLTEYGLVAEEWGGDTMIVPISAKQNQNIDKLLETILLLAEVHNFRANPKRLARGSVIEAKIEKGRGPVANVIVLNGTLKVGDTVVAGTTTCKVRAMTDHKGKAIKQACPGTPVSILGFTEVPNAGDSVLAVADEKVAKQVAAERIAKQRQEQISSAQKMSLEDLLAQTGTAKLRDLNIIIKADVKGSAEALKESLSKLANDEARAHVVHSGVGVIAKTDIMLAEVSKSIIIGFNVRPDNESKQLAEKAHIDIHTYKVIYEAIDSVEKMLKGMLTPKYREIISGRAEVRNVFKITGSGIVAGSYVTNGKIYRASHARIIRGDEVVFDGKIKGLKRFKEDVKEVGEGYECGISIADFSEIKELDIIEAYQLERIEV